MGQHCLQPKAPQKQHLKQKKEFHHKLKQSKWVAAISAENHKRQFVTAKREKSQTPKFVSAILT